MTFERGKQPVLKYLTIQGITMDKYLLATSLVVLLITVAYGQTESDDSPASTNVQTPGMSPSPNTDNLAPSAIAVQHTGASITHWHKHSLETDLRDCLKYDSNNEIRGCVAKRG
jgi:hypothetical protein